jgi:two-component system, LytTR family, response regulator
MTQSLQKIKALVIDDELHARENLKLLITEFCKGVEVIGEACGKTEAIEVINKTTPDVIFLDIRMPSGAEGFELLDAIPNKTFQVIFVTAFKDYAIKAFNANAIHYLLKPVDIEELISAVEKIKANKTAIEESSEQYADYFKRLEQLTVNLSESKSSKITINHSKGIKIIGDNTIVRLQAEGNCSRLFFTDGSTYLDTRTLKTYESLLDASKFFRVHKSDIINLDFLSEYSNQDGNFAIMNNGDTISISRSKVNVFIDRIKNI